MVLWGGRDPLHLASFLASVFFLAGWRDGNEYIKHLCWMMHCRDKETGDFYSSWVRQIILQPLLQPS
jgi:hypothetical protein